MGWNAYATTPDGAGLKFSFRLEEPHITLVNLAFAKAFLEAERRAKWLSVDGIVDGFLHLGGLDSSSAGRALEIATGESVWIPRGWPSEIVKRLAANATWPDALDWAAASAKCFLETCAESGLGVRFSW